MVSSLTRRHRLPPRRSPPPTSTGSPRPREAVRFLDGHARDGPGASPRTSNSGPDGVRIALSRSAGGAGSGCNGVHPTSPGTLNGSATANTTRARPQAETGHQTSGHRLYPCRWHRHHGWTRFPLRRHHQLTNFAEQAPLRRQYRRRLRRLLFTRRLCFGFTFKAKRPIRQS